MAERFFFRKDEKLCLRSEMNEVIESGKKMSVFPFAISYIIKPKEENGKSKIAISAPKRNFKKAVDRNLLKRRIREAYRLNKQNFIKNNAELNIQFNILFIYVHKQKSEYAEIERAVVKTLEKLSARAKEYCNISVGSSN